MKIPTLCGAILTLTLAGPALATPRFAVDAPVGIPRIQDIGDSPATAPADDNKEAAAKDTQKEKAPPKKKGESHTQERARQIQDFNRARGALGH